MLDLSREPVVVQVPDFGTRFWVFQATDLRTDGFADLGLMYGTKPGFYLLAGPDWNDTVPPGIAAIFRARTNIGTIIPRVFQEEDRGDNGRRLQSLLEQIMAYPLSEFDGSMKTTDWSRVGSIPWVKLGAGEWRWVKPQRFFDLLPEVLAATPPLPGEEALYALVRSVLEARPTSTGPCAMGGAPVARQLEPGLAAGNPRKGFATSVVSCFATQPRFGAHR